MRAAWIIVVALTGSCRSSNAPTPADAEGEQATNGGAPRVPFSAREIERILGMSPLPETAPDTTNAVYENEHAARLGQALFFDKRLSKSQDTACVTCHDPAHGWTDGKPLSEGVTRLDRNALSIWNVAHNRWFFWDGRTDSLWSQALTPLEHPLEHASSRLQIAHVIHRDPDLNAAYEAIFEPLPDLADEGRFPPTGRPVSERELAWIEDLARRKQADGLAPEHQHRAGAHFIHPHQRSWDEMQPADQESVTRIFANVGKSIAAFERRIVASASAFDVFVEGLRTRDASKLAALDASAQRGLKLFIGRAACHICHQGPSFSDREFHDIGIPPSSAVAPPDRGRIDGLLMLKEYPFNGAGRWSDDPDGAGRERIAFLPTHGHGSGAEFKTPSLRNVAVTGPYMHQGQMPTLSSVLDHYSNVPDTPENVLTPLNLSAAEHEDLLRFLESLTDTNIDERLTRPLPLSR
ncbi:MAG: cytochrome c peroxidase [Chlamydiales bacterium]|jgi:cytochrome c peroxidase